MYKIILHLLNENFYRVSNIEPSQRFNIYIIFFTLFPIGVFIIRVTKNDFIKTGTKTVINRISWIISKWRVTCQILKSIETIGFSKSQSLIF